MKTSHAPDERRSVAHVRAKAIASADARTLGERVADRVAAFGGSWTFIFLFFAIMLGWALLNTEILGPSQRAFDPYPYVFLNLMLSMLAALQAPVIMMSQNRMANLDRAHAEADYEINLQAELEIRRLHEKLDELRESRWMTLVAQQERQIEMLQALLARETARGADAASGN